MQTKSISSKVKSKEFTTKIEIRRQKKNKKNNTKITSIEKQRNHGEIKSAKK